MVRSTLVRCGSVRKFSIFQIESKGRFARVRFRDEMWLAMHADASARQIFEKRTCLSFSGAFAVPDCILGIIAISPLPKTKEPCLSSMNPLTDESLSQTK